MILIVLLAAEMHLCVYVSISISLFVCLVSEAIADPLVETYIQQGMETANELSIS